MKLKLKVEANDTLPLLDILVMKRGPKLATKVYLESAYRSLSALQVQPRT
jgi:hypothetical protein